ncbi:bifunctional RNase H/acid phosphatase [Allonocardiopsis opalescens]|uniref:Putative phosphoglycerate mutase n=1 Tax=Allonocardiopsis opalescens TaxID=1144618 RepID=A0A2T0PU78_9ACTN|nr:bifunctional RNase H/acid phosphatase [Allonocardiopsis opalescens]PRX92454.1 putative phosphoglycerate mutase [Allonocardiopsis opalescens]
MTRHVIIEADGGSRGNPGPAGYGALVREPDGGVLSEVAESIGRATNNVAEYRGLIAGLEAAAAIAPGAHVEVRMDSKLVVEQMSGRWKVKHPDMQPLAARAAELARGFGSVRYTWVPRARNAHADRLANGAMDAAARTGQGAAPAGGAAQGKGRGGPAAAPARPPAGADAADGGRPEPADPGWADPAAGPGPTALVLVRAGLTAASAEHRFGGADTELTDAGVEQARAAGRRLAKRGGVAAVAAAPQRSARRTAQELASALGVEPIPAEGLREADFGEWEGRSFAEVRRDRPEQLAAWLSDPSAAPPGGESLASVARRTLSARNRLLAAHPGVTLVVVCPLTPIRVLLQRALLAPPEAVHRLHLDPGSLSEIHHFADGPAVVRSVNDTAHLG